MKTILFPGQGSQRVGMGGDLFDKYKSYTATSDEILGYSIKELCLNDPELRLKDTRYTQPALFVVNMLSYLEHVATHGKPDFMAGHSLGEFNALWAAGAYDFESGLKMVRRRAALMAAAKEGGMAAVVGLDLERIHGVIEENDLQNIDIANKNAPSQTVISGPKEDILNAQFHFEAAGCAAYVVLNVSGAFHSRLMHEASLQFRSFIDQFEFRPPEIPVISNVSAKPYDKSVRSIKETLSRQIDHAVNWSGSIAYLRNLGMKHFIEVGPGEVLTKLTTKIKRETPLLDVGDVDSGFTSPIKDMKEKPARHQTTVSPRLVFMYAGHGSQYLQMGKELYESNDSFKEAIDHCSRSIEPLTGIRIEDMLYNTPEIENNGTSSSSKYVHLSLFCVQYALSKVLDKLQVFPGAVLGLGMGEFNAAVTGGILSLDDALTAMVFQIQKNEELNAPQKDTLLVNVHKGSLLESSLYEGTEIIGTLNEVYHIITGSKSIIGRIKGTLDNEEVMNIGLPMDDALHSPQVGPMEQLVMAHHKKLKWSVPDIPVFSGTQQHRVKEDFPQHYGNVIRKAFCLSDTIEQMHDYENLIYIDLSPDGILSGALKYGFPNIDNRVVLMNQFGQDRTTLKTGVQKLEQLLV